MYVRSRQRLQAAITPFPIRSLKGRCLKENLGVDALQQTALKQPNENSEKGSPNNRKEKKKKGMLETALFLFGGIFLFNVAVRFVRESQRIKERQEETTEKADALKDSCSDSVTKELKGDK